MIYEIPNLLSADECNYYVKEIDVKYNRTQTQFYQDIIDEPRLCARFWSAIDKAKLPKELNIEGITNKVTISRHNMPLKLHVDKPMPGVAYKLAVYLNKTSIGGGTAFYDTSNKNRKVVAPEIGKGVVFDILLPHEGDDFPSGELKYMIGFRLITKN